MKNEMPKNVTVSPEPSSYESVREIFTQLKDIHIKLRDQLLDARTTDEKTQFVRDSLRQHEEQQVCALENYIREGDAAVLDCWMQYVPLESIEQTLAGTDLSEGLTADELLRRKAAVDEALVGFLDHLARETSIPRVEEAFRDMAEQARQEMRQQSWRFREMG